MTPPNGSTPAPVTVPASSHTALVDQIVTAMEEADRAVTLAVVRREVEDHSKGCSIKEYIIGLKAQIRLSVMILGLFGATAIVGGYALVKMAVNTAVEDAVDRGFDKRLPALRMAVERTGLPPLHRWDVVPQAQAQAQAQASK